MLTINGKKYAKDDREFTDSLFHTEGGTCVGYYKVIATGVQFFDHQKNLFAFCVCRNKHTRPWQAFFVNASTIDGKNWYQHGLGDYHLPKFGIDGTASRAVQFRLENEAAQQVVNQLPQFNQAAVAQRAEQEQTRIRDTWNFR